MLSIGVAHSINSHKQDHAQDEGKRKANKHVDSYYIEYSKQDQQTDQSSSEPGNVLRLQTFELDGLIYSFIDGVNT